MNAAASRVAGAIAAAAAGLPPGVLARIAGPLGAAAREVRELRAPTFVRGVLLEGVAHADPSWLAAGLRALPMRARAAIASAASPIDVWLARRACAGLPPMPAPASAVARPGSLDEALALSAAQLGEWLVGVGADQLAFAVGPGDALDELVRRTPRAAAAARRINEAPRAGQLGPRRAAIARSRGAFDDTLLLRIGARALAPHAAAVPLARAVLRCRLPVELGRIVDAELRSHAGDGVDQAPTWPALGAG